MKLREGGSALRNLRKQFDLTLEDVKREVLAKSGIKLETSDISRLENGRVTEPSLLKAITYGTFLGMTPNDIARAYGIWGPPKEMLENRYIKIVQQLAGLPDDKREHILTTIETLVRSEMIDQGAKSRENS